MKNLKMINMRNFAKLCSCMIVGSSLMLTACGDGRGDSSPTFTNDEFKNYLKNTEWTLNPSGEPSTSNFHILRKQITVNFHEIDDQSAFNFSVGCNNNAGSYIFSGNNVFTPNNIVSTEMFCPELDDIENQFEAFFNKNIQFHVSRGTGMTVLHMKADDGTGFSWYEKRYNSPTAEHQALLTKLKNYRWQLIESTDVEIQKNLDLAAAVNPVSLNFGNSKERTTVIDMFETSNVSYSTGCSNITGEFVLVDNNDLDVVDTVVSKNEKGCSPTLQNANESLTQFFSSWGSSNLSIEEADKPILTQTFQAYKSGKKTKMKWQGTKKTFTAKVEGKMFKRTPQGTEVLKEETQTFNNVTFSDAGFCDNLPSSYSFLHQQFSNMFETTCEYDGQSKILMTADAPDTDEKFSYMINLTENFPVNQ